MTQPPMIQMLRRSSGLAVRRRAARRLAGRATCVTLVGLLGIGVLPAMAHASPPVPASPVAVRAVVGLRQGSTGSDVKAVQQAAHTMNQPVPAGK